jgi:phage gpG-like protein
MADILTIQIADQDLLAALRPVWAELQEPSEMLWRMGAVMERNVQLRFETKTDPNDAPWADLAPATVESYAQRYDGKTPGSLLERSGHMLRSLSSQVIGGVLEVGFGEGYAGYHETGRKDGKMPRRGMLAGDWQSGQLGDGDRQDLIDEIEAFLAERAAR